MTTERPRCDKTAWYNGKLFRCTGVLNHVGRYCAGYDQYGQPEVLKRGENWIAWERETRELYDIGSEDDRTWHTGVFLPATGPEGPTRPKGRSEAAKAVFGG